MTEKEVVTPECLYYPKFVTPAIFKPGSTVFKKIRCLIKDFRQREKYYKAALPPYKPRKRRKHKRKR